VSENALRLVAIGASAGLLAGIFVAIPATAAAHGLVLIASALASEPGAGRWWRSGTLAAPPSSTRAQTRSLMEAARSTEQLVDASLANVIYAAMIGERITRI